MITYEVFEEELQEALYRLYDPGYQPPDTLCQAIGCDPQEGGPAVRAAILHAVASLEPPPTTPPAAEFARLERVGERVRAFGPVNPRSPG